MATFSLKNVGKQFGRNYVLRHVSFSLPDRGFYAIKGKSGSGKSTLLNLLSGLLQPEEGSVYFKGKNLASFSKNRIRQFRLKDTAMLFQHYNLIDGATGLENVSLAAVLAGVSREKARKKAAKLFKDFKMESLMNKNVDLCSGGEKQRIAVLRALIGNPKVLFCDEPTGALDEENAKFVMKVLKEQAQRKLVIMVSHNEDLIAEYADAVLLVENKKLTILKQKEEKPLPDKGKQTNLAKPRGWTSFFTWRNLRRNALVDLISFTALLIGFSALLVTAGFYQGSRNVLEEEPKKSVVYRAMSISEKSYLETENSPLRLVRKKRPEMENVLDLLEGTEGVSIVPDYTYFFPASHAFSMDQNPEPLTSFELYQSFDQSIIKEGSAPLRGEQGCLVNEEFVTEHPEVKLGSEVAFSENYSITYHGVKDVGVLHFSFLVKGIVSEFSFLNSEKVYVPYPDIQELLERERLENLSAYLEKEVTAANIQELLPSDHAATGYQYLLFAEDDEAVETLFRKKEELEEESNTIGIASNAYEAKTAFGSLTDAFALSLVVFVAIASLGVGLILAMTAYSGFIKRKKETAILLVLGAPEGQVGRIYLAEETSLSLFAAIGALLLLPLIQKGADAYLSSQFSLNGLVQIPLESFFGIPFLLPAALLVFAFLFSSISCLIPLRAIGRMPLAEILHDE